MKHVIYIEDDLDIGEWTKRELENSHYKVTWFNSGENIYDYLDKADIVILDIMLPGLDGFTLGKRIKMKYPNLPIIILSARSSLDDKIQGLDFSDDYLTKPFHPQELIARLEVLLRRHNNQDKDIEIISHLKVHINEHRIIDMDEKKDIVLSGKQYQLFFYFIRHINEVLTKEQIFESIWRETYIDGDKTLMVHIRHLREKIEKNPSNPLIIKTIHGIGYKLQK
ncbi:response regulator transcription factor [Priestia megaterium]|uniref:response regulator transcription factor n=1 Tax=Priestia megaterium TaxID=1404 RepID=UPI00077D7E79|nr:response regulator transcription factor [Priestia megaterium]